MTERLSRATLPRVLPTGVTGPAVDPRALRTGVVHFGIGAFHRAHQAIYTEAAMAATGEMGWGILGVTGRSRNVVDQLAPQDCLYSVLTKGLAETSLHVAGPVTDVAFPGERTPDILAALAAESTHVVSLTITEKAYLRTLAGSLDLAHPDVAADLASARAADPSRSAIGLLARGILGRALADGAPLTVVTCDNIVANGTVTERLVTEFLAALPTAVSERAIDWVERNVAFPSTMVDRIVPATTEANRAEAQTLLGRVDAGLVVGEPFREWVIEDWFAAPRPAWERGGAALTPDVAPFEKAKLRILNGAHSVLAYGGALRGYATIAQSMADPVLAAAAEAVVADALPTLAPPGRDLRDYADSILTRFANPSTGHRTIQIAMDGSQKIPIRWMGTAADRLAAGHMPDGIARAVAAWIAFVRRSTTAGDLPLDDPLADELRAAAAGDEGGLVTRMLSVRAVFPPEVGDDAGFAAAVRGHLTDWR